MVSHILAPYYYYYTDLLISNHRVVSFTAQCAQTPLKGFICAPCFSVVFNVIPIIGDTFSSQFAIFLYIYIYISSVLLLILKYPFAWQDYFTKGFMRFQYLSGSFMLEGKQEQSVTLQGRHAARFSSFISVRFIYLLFSILEVVRLCEESRSLSHWFHEPPMNKLASFITSRCFNAAANCFLEKQRVIKINN